MHPLIKSFLFEIINISTIDISHTAVTDTVAQPLRACTTKPQEHNANFVRPGADKESKLSVPERGVRKSRR